VSGLSPEVSILLIAIGLVFALVCYLLTNLSPGGMITPGWLALVLVLSPRLAALIGVVVVLTYGATIGIQRVVILYGKRLFATVVLVAVFLQLTAFMFFLRIAPEILDYTTLGFIVPGLIAYQLIRQPVAATLISTAAVTSLAYTIMLAGILLRLVPVEAGTVAAENLGSGTSAPVASAQLTFLAVGVLVLVGVVAWQFRSVSRERPARVLEESARWLDVREPAPNPSDGELEAAADSGLGGTREPVVSAAMDELRPDHRAVLELIVRRGQGYADLSATLGTPAGRVRDMAHDVLVGLAPTAAERVEGEWRGRVADYVLGQGEDDEAGVTAEHLRSSADSRAWALYLCDCLGELYRDGRPEIPSAGNGNAPALAGVAMSAR